MKAKNVKTFLLALVFAPVMAWAAAALELDRAPDVQNDKAALRSGAATFVNYCLNCHGLSFVRYKHLGDLGLSDAIISNNLMFTGDKLSDPMRIAARAAEQKQWFGVSPPDLSLIARARASEAGSGADWLYTYLRSFYRDSERSTGWNNTLFANVGMSHVFWELQGEQAIDPVTHQLKLALPGSLSPAEYDKKVGDLVGFLVWASDPSAAFRKQVGFGVLAFLIVLFCLTYALKKEYWKDVK